MLFDKLDFAAGAHDDLEVINDSVPADRQNSAARSVQRSVLRVQLCNRDIVVGVVGRLPFFENCANLFGWFRESPNRHQRQQDCQEKS
jgi:hypothetical protein